MNDALNIPYCSLSTWKTLYDAAVSFGDIACWEWMSDSDLFGVQDPEDSEIGYCCVLGQLGEVYGLVVYLGSSGLEQHRKIQSGRIHAGSPDLAYSQNCLTAWFGARSDLDKNDLKVVKELGLKFRGSDAWPQFRSMRHGYLPWYLTESEATFLTLCLEQARQIALVFEKDPESLKPPRKNVYLVRVRGDGSPANWPDSSPAPRQRTLFSEPKEPPGRGWNDQWLSPAPSPKVEVKPFPLDEIRLQRIKKISQQQNGAWEIDGFFTHPPVGGDGRPFFPYVFLCADHDSGFIFSTVVAEPSKWGTEFPKAFLESIEQHRLFPNKLRVRREELRELFAPLGARLGIRLELTKKLPAADHAKRALLKFMERGR